MYTESFWERLWKDQGCFQQRWWPLMLLCYICMNWKSRANNPVSKANWLCLNSNKVEVMSRLWLLNPSFLGAGLLKNMAQGGRTKIQCVNFGICWHFSGHLNDSFLLNIAFCLTSPGFRGKVILLNILLGRQSPHLSKQYKEYVLTATALKNMGFALFFPHTHQLPFTLCVIVYVRRSFLLNSLRLSLSTHTLNEQPKRQGAACLLPPLPEFPQALQTPSRREF